MIVIVTGQIPAIFPLQLSSAQQRGNFKLPAYTACEKSFENILSCRNGCKTDCLTLCPSVWHTTNSGECTIEPAIPAIIHLVLTTWSCFLEAWEQTCKKPNPASPAVETWHQALAKVRRLCHGSPFSYATRASTAGRRLKWLKKAEGSPEFSRIPHPLCI